MSPQVSPLVLPDTFLRVARSGVRRLPCPRLIVFLTFSSRAVFLILFGSSACLAYFSVLVKIVLPDMV